MLPYANGHARKCTLAGFWCEPSRCKWLACELPQHPHERRAPFACGIHCARSECAVCKLADDHLRKHTIVRNFHTHTRQHTSYHSTHCHEAHCIYTSSCSHQANGHTRSFSLSSHSHQSALHATDKRTDPPAPLQNLHRSKSSYSHQANRHNTTHTHIAPCLSHTLIVRNVTHRSKC